MVTATLTTTVSVLNTRQEEVVNLQGFVVDYKWSCSRISVVVVVAVFLGVAVVVVAEHVVVVVVVAFEVHFLVVAAAAAPPPHLAFLSEASFI